MAVRIDTVVMMGRSVMVAVEMSWMSRCPAVRFAVRRTPRASGRIRRLIVSIIIRIGINGVGVPSGSRWPREIVGWFRRPISSVASQSGKARAMFIDSWVVGVNVYGKRPRRLVVSRSAISDVRMIAHLWPDLFNGIMSCLVIVWMSHSCRVDRRLVIHRAFGIGRSRAGNNIDRRINGIPRRYGLEN